MDVTLGGLFLSSFLAATLLPGGSEFVLYAVLAAQPALYWPALAAASVGNTLGGLTSYVLGRLVPAPNALTKAPGPPALKANQRRALGWAQRYGAPILLLSWVPIVGDALCVAAGWLRWHPLAVTLYMFIGKFGRYWVIAHATAG